MTTVTGTDIPCPQSQPPEWLARAITTAARLMQSGALAEAQKLLIAILEREPRHADSLYLLGSVAGQSGDVALGEALLRQAVAIDPGKGLYWVLLGNFVQRQERLEESEVCYETALATGGEFADPYYNWGNTCERQGRNADARRLFRRAVQLAPDFVEARNNLANQLRNVGELAEAAAHLEYALRRQPAWMPLSLNLGNVYMAQDRFVDALACFDTAIRLQPEVAVLYSNRGNALRAAGRTVEALAAYEEAIARDAARSEFWVNRGMALQTQGRMGEALESFERSLAASPDNAAAHGAALFSMHYNPRASVESLRAAHEQWGARHAARLARQTPHRNRPDPERRLRIGYVSADFRQHPISFFTAPAWEMRDRNQVELVAYFSGAKPDKWTARVQGAVDQWVGAAGLSDRELADRVEADGIDILVDLSGHTAGNRLEVFARQPAPVQVSWLGYFNTTGMQSMDYLVVDDVLAPESERAPFVEQPLRLGDGCYLSYRGPEYAPAVAAPPCLSAPGGAVTFGCFNTLSKITPNVVALWASLLQAVPGSRLVLKNAVLNDSLSRQLYEGAFATRGIGPERLELLGGSSHRDLLAHYAHVDIALDPFPYNGGTTTCEALWMGVPVITLAGDRFVSRVGATVLTHAGCGEWVTHSEDEYIQVAAALAADKARLQQIRAGLQERVSQSGLGDVAGFQRRWEDAVRSVWRRWCAEHRG